MTLVVRAQFSFSDPDQQSELGAPLIRNYTLREFAADNADESGQVFSIAQDQRGVMYFGLNDNIAQFDGRNWKLIPVPSGSVRDLLLDVDGTIYASMAKDLGYLAVDDKGAISYVSLIDKLPQSQRSLTRIWSIHATSHGLYFVSKNKMYRYYRGAMEVMVDDAFFIGHTIFDNVYSIGLHKGIAVVSEGKIRHIPYFDQIEEIGNEIGKVVVLPWSNRRALIVTEKRGLFIHDLDRFIRAFDSADGVAKTDSFLTHFASEAEAYIQEHQVYCGTKINDTRFAIGTKSGGVIIIDNEGKIVQIVNNNRGLIGDRIYRLFVDRSDNLWVGTNNGIAHVAISSPITVFDRSSGIKSGPNVALRHNRTLYLCTMSGISYLPSYQINVKNDNYTFMQVRDAENQCFGMTPHKGMLIAGDNLNLIRIKDHTRDVLKSASDTILSFVRSKRFPDYIFIGIRNGMEIVKLSVKEAASNDSAQSAESLLTADIIPNKALKNIQSSFYNVFSDEKGDIWASAKNEEIYQIKWNSDTLEDFEILKYGIEDGLPSLSHNVVGVVQGQVYIGTINGLYRVADGPENSPKKRIVPETTFGKMFNEPAIRVTRIYEDLGGNPWIGASDLFGIIRRTASGAWSWDTAMTSLFSRDISVFYPDEGNVFWFSGREELFRYDATIAKNYRQEFYSLIRKVTAKNNRVLHSGEHFDPLSERDNRYTRVSLVQPSTAAPILSYQDNDVSFEFAAAFFEKPEQTKFRYQLEGFDKNWSNWSNIATKEYTNLREGEYVFQIQARNVYGAESKVASYRFSILVPWYRTLWAYMVFLAFGFAFLGVGVRLYTWRLVAAKNRLQRIVQERTAEVVRQKDEIELQRDRIKEAKDALWGEMELAKKIQTVLLPDAPQISGYEIVAYMNPADEVGGDYYDVINIDGSDWIVIGDVSGHGVPAGLVMMMVQTAIHTVLEKHGDETPATVLTTVNKVIHDNIKKLGESKYMTITLFSCQNDGALYYSGLHQDILVFRDKERDIEKIETNGIWIGILQEITGMLIVENLTLRPGDVMFLFTDGITEARDEDGKMFSVENLLQVLKENGDKPVREIERSILEALEDLCCTDDITFIIVKRKLDS